MVLVEVVSAVGEHQVGLAGRLSSSKKSLISAPSQGK